MKSRNEYKLRFFLSVSFLLLGGVGCLYISELISDELILKDVLGHIGTAFFFTGVFGIVQEFILKDKLVDVILSKLKLKEDINRTGIESIFFGISDIDYGYYLKRAKSNIDIIHIYGRTWTNNYIDEIEDRLLNSNCKVRVVLLSPDSLFVPALAEHFDETPEALQQKIKDVSKLWKGVYEKKEKTKKRKTQSSIQLYFHRGMPANSLYRIDERIVFVQNKLTKGKSKRLPLKYVQKVKKRRVCTMII